MNLDFILNEASKKLGCDIKDLDWYSFPLVFGSTSGPRGAGGNSITKFQCICFIGSSSMGVKYCGGVWARWDGDLSKAMRRW